MKILLAMMLMAGPLMAQQAETLPLQKGKMAQLAEHAIGSISFRMAIGGKSSAYVIEILEDGSGKFMIFNMPEVPSPAARLIKIGVETLDRINAGYDAVARNECETKLKNIAKTGEKHIRYQWKNSEVFSECDFNYSDDEALNKAAAAFQAIAETIQAGDRLKYKKRFDHLGLDAELDGLIAQVKSGYAIELQNIAPILRSIAEDDEFLASSRRKATNLLTMAVAPGEKK